MNCRLTVHNDAPCDRLSGSSPQFRIPTAPPSSETMEAVMAMRTSLFRVILTVMAGLFVLSAQPQVRAQDITLPGDFPPRVKKRKPKPDVLPVTPNRSPSFTILVSSLGYGTPSLTYLGR